MSEGVVVFSLVAGLILLLSVIIALLVFLFLKRKRLRQRSVFPLSSFYQKGMFTYIFTPENENLEVSQDKLKCFSFSTVKQSQYNGLLIDKCKYKKF